MYTVEVNISYDNVTYPIRSVGVTNVSIYVMAWAEVIKCGLVRNAMCYVVHMRIQKVLSERVQL